MFRAMPFVLEKTTDILEKITDILEKTMDIFEKTSDIFSPISHFFEGGAHINQLSRRKCTTIQSVFIKGKPQCYLIWVKHKKEMLQKRVLQHLHRINPICSLNSEPLDKEKAIF